MALDFYASSARDFATGVVTWTTGSWNVLLMTNTYTFADGHNFRDDITNEVTGTGYSSGGLLLDNRSASAADPCVLTADDEVIAQNGGGFSNARKYAFSKITGGAASTDPLLAYGVAGADFGNVAGQLTLDVPANFISIDVP